MDDQDLIHLQKEVFDQDLQKPHITALKQIVVNDEYDEAKALKGIDFEAFKTLMKKYIQKMKGQTCWKLLKHFGYDTHLGIKRQIWDDKSISDEVLGTARSFELTKNAIQYIKKLFNMYKVQNSQTNESILDQQGIEKVFATCSKDEGLPFDAKSET